MEGNITFTIPVDKMEDVRRARDAAGCPTAHQYVKWLLGLPVNLKANPGKNWQGGISIKVPEKQRDRLLSDAKKYGYDTPTEYARALVSQAIGGEVRPALQTPAPEVPEEGGREQMEQEESDEGIERRLVERLQQQRDRRKAAALKMRYDNTCMFCGTQLQIAEDRFYSEAAHIKGLGKPHNGPDEESNMLVLCPNHHIQFDEGILRLYKVGNFYRIESKAADNPLHGKTIALDHFIDDDCAKYHRDLLRVTTISGRS